MHGLWLKRKSKDQRGNNIKVNISFPSPFQLFCNLLLWSRRLCPSTVEPLANFLLILPNFLAVFNTIGITSSLNCFPHLSFRTLVFFLPHWLIFLSLLCWIILFFIIFDSLVSPTAQALDPSQAMLTSISLTQNHLLADDAKISISSSIHFLNS